MCGHLRVLFLYDNLLERMTGLETLRNLTELYLQNNAIQQIEGLEALSKLRIL
jgi:Leucine-rich repeat (LRR) protein